MVLMTLEIDKIYCMDCLDGMKQLDDSRIDMILCDRPYGVTQNKKDIALPLDKLWIQYKRIIKERGAIVLTSQFPLTIDLIQSSNGLFKYDLIWDKILCSGFLNAKRMPLRTHEHILVFYNKLPTYNPQFTRGKPTHSRGKLKAKKSINYGEYNQVPTDEKLGNNKYPTSIIRIQKPHASKALHPTQKPIDLFEYLIKTFTNEGELILDNCMGSGTTAIACKQLNRHFVGFDNNQEYVDIANKRLASIPPRLDAFDIHTV